MTAYIHVEDLEIPRSLWDILSNYRLPHISVLLGGKVGRESGPSLWLDL
jgi:hypothetical protein